MKITKYSDILKKTQIYRTAHHLNKFGKFSIGKISFFSLNLSVVSMSIKSSAGFYVDIDEEIDKLFLKFIWTCKGPRIARKILKEQH